MSGLHPEIWGQSLIMCALLIGVVLLVRRPVAALFGPRLGYALWLIPALRLVLPPLPGGERVVEVAVASNQLSPEILAMGSVGAPVPAAATSFLDFLVAGGFSIWIAGAFAVIAHMVWRHIRWHRALLRGATKLEAVDGITVVMSPAVVCPVATGLLSRTIAVPTDFFARYSRTERLLAIEHEVAHHRAGDLWANAAALVVLAAQWFNPLAWWAMRAFRFDQEAACDARVLAAVEAVDRREQAHSYACAIAKSVAGPRLMLAAPMTSGNEVKERLLMLNHDPKLGTRPLFGRLLLGGTTVAALALTISTLPARIVYAAEPDAPPPIGDAPPPPGAPTVKEKQIRHVIVVDGNAGSDVDWTEDGSDKEASTETAAKPAITRMVVREAIPDGGEHEVMVLRSDAADPIAPTSKRQMRIAMPHLGIKVDELRATLKEQGIDDAKADAIIKQVEQKRARALPERFGFNSVTSDRVRVLAIPNCKPGDAPKVLIDNSAGDDHARSQIRMVQCSGAAIAKDKQIEAMKRARDRMAAQKDSGGMGADIRASVVADLDRAIAELQKSSE